MPPKQHSLWPPSFKAAIFDFDGTISDTAALWNKVDRAFLSSRGLPFTADYQQNLSALGFKAGARYTIERFGLDEGVDDICAEWKRLGRALYASSATLRPGAANYIRALREHGIGVALATVNDADMLDAIQHVRFDALFDVRVHGTDVTRPKDHPDIYLEAARQLGVGASDCMVFEDVYIGARSAKSAGMAVCGVRANDHSQFADELRSYSDVWVEDWRDALGRQGQGALS